MFNLCKASNERRLGLWLGLSLLVSLGNNAWSQENRISSRPSPPPGVLLNVPPEFSQWIVTYSYPQDRPARTDTKPSPLNGDLPRRVTVTKTKDIIHEEIVTVSGAKHDKWQNSGKYYMKPTNQAYWGEYDASFAKDYQISDFKLLPVPSDKFRGLEWVGGKTYAGSLKDQGREYLLFIPTDSTSVNFNDATALKSLPVVAYIDAATRLPIAYKSGDIVQQYIFGNAPAEMQAFPADLSQEIKDGNERHAKVFVAPHAEY